MKIIFLDIDGVLNTDDNWGKREPKEASTPHCIAALNKITNATGAKIVVSSAWRIDRTVQQLKDILAEMGVIGEVIGKTPSLDGQRVTEIKAWISMNLGDWPESFITIDDEWIGDSDEFQAIHIKPYYREGLTEAQADQAITLLGGEN